MSRNAIDTMSSRKVFVEEAEGQRSRSKKMPRRRAQKCALEELRAINPVLISPEDFVPSLKR